MSAMKTHFIVGPTKTRRLPQADYPPTAKELEARLDKFRTRERALTAANKDIVWSKAAEMHPEAGGNPRFAEHVEVPRGKPDV